MEYDLKLKCDDNEINCQYLGENKLQTTKYWYYLNIYDYLKICTKQCNQVTKPV